MPQGESNITRIAENICVACANGYSLVQTPNLSSQCFVNILVRGLITMLGHMVVDQILSGLMTTSA